MWTKASRSHAPKAVNGTPLNSPGIGAAAFILGRQGEIRETNAAGAALMDHDRARWLEAIRAAVLRRPPGATSVEITPLRGTGEPHGTLAIVRTPAASTTAKVIRASERWGLTPRQAQVLERLARGLSNRTLAADLGVAERTVEAHLTAIFDKVGLDTRASLLARVLGMG